MVILDETKSLAVDFVLHEAIKVCLVAEVSEKVTNIVHSPRVEGSSGRVRVSCWWDGRGRGREREKREGERGERERERER